MVDRRDRCIRRRYHITTICVCVRKIKKYRRIKKKMKNMKKINVYEEYMKKINT